MTGIGTSSVAAVPALPTVTAGTPRRRGGHLRRISGRAAEVHAGAATDLMIDMDMIITVVITGEWVEEVVMQMRSPMAGLDLVQEGDIKMVLTI